MSERSSVLEAVFSAVIGEKVRIASNQDESYVPGPLITIDQVFESSYVRTSTHDIPGVSWDFSIFVILFSGKTITLTVSSVHQIRDIKEMIEIKEGIPAHTIRLQMFGKGLQDDFTVQDAKIQPNVTLIALARLVGGGIPAYLTPKTLNLDITGFAPSYNYDFTDKVDDGKTYMRGGHQYNRPYGWYRFALDVQKYGDSSWLGPNGIRTHSVGNEWAVGYHGTKQSKQPDCVVGKIVKEGFIPGPRQLFGIGVYTSPSLKMIGNNYADSVVNNGITSKFAFQTRVDPARLEVKPKIIEGADYWLSPDSSAVRPYGLIVQEVGAQPQKSFHNISSWLWK